MKKVGILVCVVLMAMLLLVSTAMADDERTSGAFTYRIKGNGTAAITGYDWVNNWGADIYIPRMLDGYTVTEISEEAFTRLSRDSNGVIKAEFHATAGVLSIPDTVLYIGEKAFMNVYFEKDTITIPASVEYIGAGAFSYCGCKQFVVDQQNPVYATIDGAIYNKKKKELIAYPARFSLTGSPGAKRFLIKIPEGIVGIGDYAMFGLGDVKHAWGVSYRLPSSLKYIGDYAFAHNWGFNVDKEIERSVQSGIYLPDGLTTIGEGAFYNICNYDRQWDGHYLTLGDLSNTQITEIPALAFWGLELIGYDLILPDSLISIGYKAFENGSFRGIFESKELRFPASLKYIDDYAFANAAFCGNIIFPADSALVSIGKGAFQGSSFEKVYFKGKISLPNKVENIGEKAFWGIDNLDWIVIPDSVETIGKDVANPNTTSFDVESGSYAALWASENGYNTTQSGTEDTSWLN